MVVDERGNGPVVEKAGEGEGGKVRGVVEEGPEVVEEDGRKGRVVMAVRELEGDMVRSVVHNGVAGEVFGGKLVVRGVLVWGTAVVVGFMELVGRVRGGRVVDNR